MLRFGLAPVEAAMSGVPVIASSLDVMREVLSLHGRPCAVFVSGDDPARWAKAVSASLATAASRTQAQADAVHLREKYGEQRMIDAYTRLLKSSPAFSA